MEVHKEKYLFDLTFTLRYTCRSEIAGNWCFMESGRIIK